MKRFILYSLPLILGSLPLCASVQVQSLQTSTEIPLASEGVEMRFTNLSPATASGSGYVLLEGLRPLGGDFESWSITSYTTYNDDGTSTGETGIAVLDIVPAESEPDTAYSDIVGIMPVSKPITDMVATPLDADWSPPVDGTAEFRQGRLLMGFGGAEPANIGYQVDPGSSLTVDDFDLVTSEGTFQVNGLELKSTQNGLGLSGVYTTGSEPIYGFNFSAEDENTNGSADPIDPDKIWFEAAPLLQQRWRLTDLASNSSLGLGLILEDSWPWVYSYRLDGGKWIWIYDAEDDPTEFWAYNSDGFWMYMSLESGRFYYHWTNKEWVRW